MGVLSRIRGKSAEPARPEPTTPKIEIATPQIKTGRGFFEFGPGFLPPANSCPKCSCPIVWISVYDRDELAGQDAAASPISAAAFRCWECEPPPARSLVADRWLLVLGDDDLPEWERLELRDWRRDPWGSLYGEAIVDERPVSERPAVARAAIDQAAADQLPRPGGQPAGSGEGQAATAGGVAKPNSDGLGDGLGDLTGLDDLKQEPPPWTTEQVSVGTLSRHRVPIEVPVGPVGSIERSGGATLTVFAAGWNDLTRLTARHGFDEAWRMLSERSF